MPKSDHPWKWRGHLPVLFADLCDYTGLGERMDPEDTEKLLGELERLAGNVLQQYGGRLVQMYGDGLLAVFGLPKPHENAALHAVHAALALRDEVRAFDWLPYAPPGFEVKLHSGVHAGLVLANEGDTVHGEYSLTGDAVSTAARLCGAAPGDHILASHTVLQGIEGFFELESPKASLTLKGKAAPVPASFVRERSASRTRTEAMRRRGVTAFVGREQELELLMRSVETAQTGQAQLVAVTGLAGIGKSRLLEHLRSTLREHAVQTFYGSCERHEDVAPLAPFRQVLRQWTGTRPGDTADEVRTHAYARLSALPLSEVVREECVHWMVAKATRDNPHDDARMIDALEELFDAWMAIQPLVLLLDDWQWADDTSRKVLASLLLDGRGRRLCVVLGTRDLDASGPLPSPEQEIPLCPFTPEESARVVSHLRPLELELGVARQLHDRAGGNPLFLDELCRALPAGPLEDGGLSNQNAPSTVQGVIQARLANLPEDHAAVLRTASVIGIEFTQSLLAQVAPSRDLGAILQDLIELDLIHSSDARGGFRFKHGIAREVVYESILKADRRRHHADIAQVLEVQGPDAQDTLAEVLATHYRCAGNSQQAVHYAEIAGDKAMRTHTLDRARAHYRSALAELDRLPGSDESRRRWLHISAQLSTAFNYSPARDQVVLLRRSAEYALEMNDTGARAQSAYSLGSVLYTLGDYDEALQLYDDALSLARLSNANRLAVQLTANMGQVHAAAGRYEQAVTSLDEAIEQKRLRRRGRGVPQGYAYALGCRAAVHAEMGAFEPAARDIADALAALRDSRHVVEGSVCALAAMVEIYREDWQACVEMGTRSRAIASRVSSGYIFATSSAYQAYGMWRRDQNPRALAQLRHSVAWLEARGLNLFVSVAQACLADALWEASEADAARQAAHAALRRADQGDPLGETWACRTLARIDATRGTEGAKDCAAWLHRGESSARRRPSPRDLAITESLRAHLGL